MMQSMFQDVSVSGWEDQDTGSGGGDIYRSWLIDQYGKAMAAHGGLGIADMVKKEMLALQEVKS